MKIPFGRFGEMAMVALFWTDGKWEAAIHLEKLWNELARSFAFSLLCAYPLRVFEDIHGASSFAKCAPTPRRSAKAARSTSPPATSTITESWTSL